MAAIAGPPGPRHVRGSLWARGATLPRLVASRGGRGEYVCTRPRRDVAGGAARLLAPAPPSVSRWPYRTLVGIESRRRAVRPGQGRAPRDLASTDPATFPEATTWFLVTHPPTPGAAAQRTHAPAAVADVGHRYGLRIRVEQSDKQVQQHLGWAEDHVRADLAIRRYWYLVCCAFVLCWWAGAYPTVPARERSADAAPPPQEAPGQEALVVMPMAGLGEKKRPAPAAPTRSAARGPWPDAASARGWSPG